MWNFKDYRPMVKLLRMADNFVRFDVINYSYDLKWYVTKVNWSNYISVKKHLGVMRSATPLIAFLFTLSRRIAYTAIRYLYSLCAQKWRFFSLFSKSSRWFRPRIGVTVAHLGGHHIMFQNRSGSLQVKRQGAKCGVCGCVCMWVPYVGGCVCVSDFVARFTLKP